MNIKNFFIAKFLVYAGKSSVPLAFMPGSGPGVPESVVISGRSAGPVGGDFVLIPQFHVEITKKDHCTAAVAVGNGTIDEDSGEGFIVPGSIVRRRKVFGFNKRCP